MITFIIDKGKTRVYFIFKDEYHIDILKGYSEDF